MRQHFKIFGMYFKLNLSAALEYRAGFFLQAFGMALSNSSFIFFWWIAFRQIGGQIAGYDFQDVLFLWAVLSSAYGLSHILFANVTRLSQLVATGELDAFLLQPCNSLINMACAKTDLSAYGDLAYGLILILVSQWGDWAAWGGYLVGSLLGAVMVTAIILAAGSLCFYLGDADVISRTVTEFILNFCLYPDKIYSSFVRVLMYTIIPAGFISHIPLRMVREANPWWGLVILGATALVCAAAALLYYRGLKRYESGNMIVTRQ